MLVWNVLHGSNDVDNGPEKTLGIIRDSGADLVLLQESYDIDGERPKLGNGWRENSDGSTGRGRVHLCVFLTRLDIEATFFHHPCMGSVLNCGIHRAIVSSPGPYGSTGVLNNKRTSTTPT